MESESDAGIKNDDNEVESDDELSTVEKENDLQLIKGVTVEKKEKKKRSKLDPEDLKKKLEVEEVCIVFSLIIVVGRYCSAIS